MHPEGQRSEARKPPLLELKSSAHQRRRGPAPGHPGEALGLQSQGSVCSVGMKTQRAAQAPLPRSSRGPRAGENTALGSSLVKSKRGMALAGPEARCASPRAK